MRQKYMLTNFKNGVKSMLITKNTVRLNNLLVKIPHDTKRLWDTSENRWGFRVYKNK